MYMHEVVYACMYAGRPGDERFPSDLLLILLLCWEFRSNDTTAYVHIYAFSSSRVSVRISYPPAENV
jgi:hypothetical protein